MELDFRIWLESVLPSMYWISPTGEVVSNFTTHMDFMFKNPQKFDMTRQEILDAHELHGEKVGAEGRAREDLLKKAMMNGWIRIRKYNRPDFWTIQGYQMSPSFIKRVAGWIYQLTSQDRSAIYSDIKITTMRQESLNCSMAEFLSKASRVA
jgi:hypothetical protein